MKHSWLARRAEVSAVVLLRNKGFLLFILLLFFDIYVFLISLRIHLGLTRFKRCRILKITNPLVAILANRNWCLRWRLEWDESLRELVKLIGWWRDFIKAAFFGRCRHVYRSSANSSPGT